MGLEHFDGMVDELIHFVIVELGDSIPQLSVAITTFITDLDNVVEGVEVAVTNVLKNVPVSVSVLDTTIEA